MPLYSKVLPDRINLLSSFARTSWEDVVIVVIWLKGPFCAKSRMLCCPARSSSSMCSPSFSLRTSRYSYRSSYRRRRARCHTRASYVSEKCKRVSWTVRVPICALGQSIASLAANTESVLTDELTRTRLLQHLRSRAILRITSSSTTGPLSSGIYPAWYTALAS